MKAQNGQRIQSTSQPPSNKSATNVNKGYVITSGNQKKSNSNSSLKKQTTLNSMTLAEEANYIATGVQQMPQSSSSAQALQFLNQKQLMNSTQYFSNAVSQINSKSHANGPPQLKSNSVHERMNSTDSGGGHSHNRSLQLMGNQGDFVQANINTAQYESQIASQHGPLVLGH